MKWLPVGGNAVPKVHMAGRGHQSLLLSARRLVDVSDAAGFSPRRLVVVSLGDARLGTLCWYGTMTKRVAPLTHLIPPAACAKANAG